MGRGSSKASRASIKTQLKNFMDSHDGELPSYAVLPTPEARNEYFTAINELYTPTADEREAMSYAYIEDGELHNPYGGFGYPVEGLSDSAIEGWKKSQARRLVNNDAIPDVKYWRRRK